MPTNTTPTPATERADAMFDAAFEHSPRFRIALPFEDAQQFIRRIGDWNEFAAESVLDALDRIDRLIPRRNYGDGNPHNGARAYELTIGREGSPVIYLDLYEFGEHRLDEWRMILACREMQVIGQADEADYSMSEFGGGRKVTFRFWWD